MLVISLALTTCSIQVTGRSVENSRVSVCSTDAVQSKHAPVNDSIAGREAELAKIYTMAIAEYIRAVYKNDKTIYDTLFFGKHVYGQPDDFPDIKLPGKIENTMIRLVTPEVGLKMQKERKSLVYINMMGWVDKKKAEFILVTFSNGCEHKFDCFIDYKYNTARREFNLENVRFEYFNKR
ncbi:MAG: hypothetical protein NT040_16150 [Bacteroidetes bacterium]|nr:hypothetical protein [Bacteroidota bacterium]